MDGTDRQQIAPTDRIAPCHFSSKCKSLTRSLIFDTISEFISELPNGIRQITSHARSPKLGSFESADVLDQIGQIARVGFWEVDFKTEKVYWSEQVREIHEVAKDFCPTLENALEFYHHADQSLLVEHIENARVAKSGFTFTGLIKTARGNPVWLRSFGKPVIFNGDLLAAGIDDFVPKPIGVEAIKQAIFRGMQKTA